MTITEAIIAAVRDEVRKALGTARPEVQVEAVQPAPQEPERASPLVNQASETTVKKPPRRSGGAEYIKGLRPDIERIFGRPEFRIRHSGLTLSELTQKLRESGFLSPSQGEPEVRRVIGGMTGRGRKICIQHNGKYNLWSNVKLWANTDLMDFDTSEPTELHS